MGIKMIAGNERLDRRRLDLSAPGRAAVLAGERLL